jgi:hypothetical protein
MFAFSGGDAASMLQRTLFRSGWIVLQNDFEPWREENFFQIKAE